MRSGWFRGSTVTAVPTCRRRVRLAIALATWSDAEITEREGMKWISPSQTQSRPQASACWASSNASRNAETWFAPSRISSTKIPKCMTCLLARSRYLPRGLGPVKEGERVPAQSARYCWRIDSSSRNSREVPS